ncbi:MAG: acetyl-CoA carboxylase biotin carboxyl carrier protein [Anaerofustis sp.]
MKVNEIKQLAEIMSTYHLSKVEISDEKSHLCLERNLSEPISAKEANVQHVKPYLKPDETLLTVGEDKLIKSPMVGIFYASEAPDANPFVSVGSKFKKGDVLCIIEAMKMMNEIVAEEDGELVEVLVDNGELVEYNQPIFKLK